MAHTFCEFVPGALFHLPILHPTAAPPVKSVNPLCTNSLLKCNEHQPPKLPNPWNSLALPHVCHTGQQNHLFCTSIYKILAHQSTFALITNALSLTQSIPSWVFSRFGLDGATRVSPCGLGGPVLGALQGSRVE